MYEEIQLHTQKVDQPRLSDQIWKYALMQQQPTQWNIMSQLDLNNWNK